MYAFGDYPSNPPRLSDQECQWRTIAKLANLAGVVSGSVVTSFITEILFPKGTDVRGAQESALGRYDTVVLTGPKPPELPFAAELPFIAGFVYDVAKGFSNEYRVAAVTKFGVWPAPIP